ncbi:MAG: fasciclin domain-containing protein [Phycisphaerae bacterium]|nr:fasciclin domain-containing protein [Phycisphaerae bacterium]
MKTWTAVSLVALVAAAGVALAGNTTPTANKPANTNSTKATANVLDTAIASGNCKTFAAAVKAAGLESTFKGEGPYTVFVPTDEAWAKLPAGTVEAFLKPENRERLASILQFHVLPGHITARDLGRMQESSQTLLGQSFNIENRENKIWVGTDIKLMASITQPDVPATNGVIHYIDAVMLPRQ